MIFSGKTCCLMTTCQGVLNISLIMAMLTLLILVTWLGWHLLDFSPGAVIVFLFHIILLGCHIILKLILEPVFSLVSVEVQSTYYLKYFSSRDILHLKITRQYFQVC